MCEGCHTVATQANLVTFCCSPESLSYSSQNATRMAGCAGPCRRHIGCNEATCKLCRHNRARVCQLDFRAQQFLAGVSTEKGLKTPCEGGSELTLQAVGAGSQDVQKDWPDVISDLQLEVRVMMLMKFAGPGQLTAPLRARVLGEGSPSMQCCSSTRSPLTAWEGEGGTRGGRRVANLPQKLQGRSSSRLWAMQGSSSAACSGQRPLIPLVAAATFIPGLHVTAAQLTATHPPAEGPCWGPHCEMQGHSS